MNQLLNKSFTKSFSLSCHGSALQFKRDLEVINARDISLRNIFYIVIAISAITTLTSCASTQAVQPWEKGFLAKPEMTFEGDALDKNFTEHTYFSKEGASGGSGVGGGGCGCN